MRCLDHTIFLYLYDMDEEIIMRRRYSVFVLHGLLLSKQGSVVSPKLYMTLLAGHR